MSGIAGIVSLQRNDYHLPTLIQEMAGRLKHRGPDDEGYTLLSGHSDYSAFGKSTQGASKKMHGLNPVTEAPADTTIAFGHRRLAVFNTGPEGYQPARYDNGRYVLVFDGDIYNFPEIRALLIKEGVTVKGETVSEILLAAFAHWGDLMANRMDGSWALLIYDKQTRTFFASRDRFGVKPFYYVKTAEYFAFASEQKALIELPFVTRRLNRGAVFEYLVMGVTEREPLGMFKEIMELMPASSLSLDLNTGIFKTWHHYHLGYKPLISEFDEDKFQKYSLRTRRLLMANMKIRLRSDVPVSACLSGGLDSASIVCLADKILKEESTDGNGKKLKVFTLAFNNKHLDESKWAQEVVKITNTDWVKVSPDFSTFFTDLEDLVYSQDLPFSGTETYAQYKLMQAIGAAGIKVTLDGQGGDELFSGYAAHFNVFMKGLVKTGEYNNFFANFLTANNSFASKTEVLSFFAKSIRNRITTHYKGRLVTRGSEPEFRYIRPEFWDRYKKRIIIENPFILNTALHHEYAGPQLKARLRSADRSSMRFGVEARVPFAEDRDLTEYIFNMPSIYKVRYGQSKLILRSAMGNTLPEKILMRRDKNAFNTPESEWLMRAKGPLREYINNDIRDLIDIKALLKDWNSVFSSAAGNGTSALWRLINFAVWRKVHKV